MSHRIKQRKLREHCRARKTLIALIIRCGFMFLAVDVMRAGSATWDLNPNSGDWNTAANWTPVTVPNAPPDAATFGTSNTTGVSISQNTEVSSITFTSGATNPYTIAAQSDFTLNITGIGIVNNSGMMQNFVSDIHFGFFSFKGIRFSGNATAGSLITFTNSGETGVETPTGGTTFFDNSSASNGIFHNLGSSTDLAGGGQTIFNNTSTAANGTFVNNGGVVVFGYGGETIFSDSSTATNGTFTNNPGVASATSVFPSSLGGVTVFKDSSSAANAVFTNNGFTVNNASSGATSFYDTSTAANARFINNGAGAIVTAQGITFPGGVTSFLDNATAANGTFINNGGTVTGANGGATLFLGSSGGAPFPVSTSAGDGVFINNGAAVSGANGGTTSFSSTSTAANGNFTNNGGTVFGAGGGSTTFQDDSTAGSAILIANSGTNGGDGGAILFEGKSTIGTARIEIFGNGSLDISLHGAIGLHGVPGMTIDSIEGDGNMFLGANTLTVGSNNSDAVFSCAIQDGGQSGGMGGSLTKIGTGTLELLGTNTYTGKTTVSNGVLKVNGSTTSDTVVKPGSTLTGSGNIDGAITGHGAISPGDGLGTLTVNTYTQENGSGRLLIDIAGKGVGNFDVLDVIQNANVNGFLNPILLNGFITSIGDEFVFLNYGSVSGTFRLQNGGIFNNGIERWIVKYQPTEAILTVANAPDEGSTLLLLTLALLSMGIYWRQVSALGRSEPVTLPGA
jgi:autotransporter-associated beta strand protein